MINFTIVLTGTEPLLMHSADLANPIDPTVKAIRKVTSKRTKTDDDYEEIARLEHAGSLYMDPQIGPYLPGENIERSLLDAARITRQGKAIERGVFITSRVNPLAYKGPRTAAGLWADESFRLYASVKVQRARTMRCRPIFHQWSADATGILDPSIIDPADFGDICATAGLMVGIGDWRPRYGRFTATLETSPA